MKDPPSRRPEDLEPGTELSGTVDSILRASDKPAAFFDVGFDRPAYLDWQEASDTFPGKAFVRLKVGKEVTCRVLKVEGDRIYVTKRSGDLYRPTFSEKLPPSVAEVVEPFRSLPMDIDLDARVLRMFPTHAMVSVKAPDGTEAEGYVPRGFYSDAFEESGAPNDQIKLQLLPEQPKAKGKRQRVMLRFKNEKEKSSKTQAAPEAEAEESEESEELLPLFLTRFTFGRSRA
eukprot:Skav200522  [mRNA]  locus=scaffold450:598106:598798:- [translate_table: standard]